MPGPPPKAPAQRRRRNAVPGRTMLPVPTSALDGKPQLQARPDGVPWHHAAIAHWDAIWDSPMAAEFDVSDVHSLLRYMDLEHEYWSIDSRRPGALREKTALAAELRLESMNFGLTPMDRRRLQWEITRADAAMESSARRSGSAAVKGKDPRAKS